ncbi:MAG TPA: 2-phospho-L-lactate transferase CofD family protein, partial [Pyrinomonadaceae bacterium]
IFVNNLMTQPGETDGYTARAHLDTVREYAPEIHFDFVVVNDRRISKEQAERYAAEGAYQIGIDDPIEDALDQMTEIVRADLLDAGEKVRHNADRLAEVVLACRVRALSKAAVTV